MTNGSRRAVARPVANLGNTCYMNAVLQALAHAPELCMAMDVAPHRDVCPVAASRRSSQEPRLLGTRKSSRKSPESSEDSSREQEQDYQFCALCEVEQHLKQVHDMQRKETPVAPTNFVNGFIERVAPWFKLGVQEDSHEFLRLLIDAMQRSCLDARESFASQDNEYPFSLFRGTVESIVICESCGYSSTTTDPIEDIGLECATLETNTKPTRSAGNYINNNTSVLTALNDVQTAFQRFARAEALDSGYKCEKCGKGGRATKQSRLASIPPILTLHLKRFRYGDSRAIPNNGARPRRSELNQLLGPSGDYMGKSGSAKIEGHIKFEQLFDLRPYLTEELQAKQNNLFCRLFAVVVHSGKNSHSGHYIAYVRSLAKNEWWKMDDGRVNPVSVDEVMRAEAYMLFYRVLQHPVAVQLEEQYKVHIENNNLAERRRPSVDAETVFKTRKRRAYDSAESWARKTSLPPHYLGILRKVEESIADNVTLRQECFKVIADEAAKDTAAIGKGPSSTIRGKLSAWTTDLAKLILNDIFNCTEEDVVGGTAKFYRMAADVLYKIAKNLDGEGPFPFQIKKEEKNRIAVVEPEDTDLL